MIQSPANEYTVLRGGSLHNQYRHAKSARYPLFIFAGLLGLGYQLADGFLQDKVLEHTVTVKGLSEREVAANIAIWPIKYNQADNDLQVRAGLGEHAR